MHAGNLYLTFPLNCTEQFPTLPFELGHRFLPVQINTILQFFWIIRSLLLDPTWHVSPRDEPGSRFSGNEKWWVSVEDNGPSFTRQLPWARLLWVFRQKEASVLNQVRRNYFSKAVAHKGPSRDSRVVSSRSFLIQPNGLMSVVRVLLLPTAVLTLTSEGWQGCEFKVLCNSAIPRIKFGD